MSDTRKLWTLLGVLLVVSFSVLLWSGTRIYEAAPPMPDRVAAADGTTIYSRAEIEKGRQVWQSMGGMQLGSIWGHGGYVAPDWSADWLHREALAVLDERPERVAPWQTAGSLPPCDVEGVSGDNGGVYFGLDGEHYAFRCRRCGARARRCGGASGGATRSRARVCPRRNRVGLLPRLPVVAVPDPLGSSALQAAAW